MSNLPQDLLSFWYPQALRVFLRVWRNLISLLEEDLAVSLMWRLLFVPLFHDSSIVGRVLSFIFRIIRIGLGVFAYFIASIGLAIIASIWFLLPLGLVFPSLELWSIALKLAFFAGAGILFYQKINYPLKTVKHLSSSSEIWLATKLKKSDVVWSKLISSSEVKDYLESLELDANFFEEVNIPVEDEYQETVFKLAKKSQARFITESYFFAAMILHIPLIETKLLKANLRPQDLIQALIFLEHKKNKFRTVWIWDEDFEVTHLKGVNRGWLGAPTPVLDSVSEDLTRLSSKFKMLDFVGRETIVSEVINILSQDNNQNVIIVGPAGSGKTSLVLHLAGKIIAGDAPSAIATKRLVSLDLAELLSYVSTQGELATKIREIFEEIRFVQNIIIFVDEIHNLGIGEVGSNLNLYGLLLPYLGSNDFQFLATTEPENYAKILEKNSAFARLFTKVSLPEATEQVTFKIVQEYSIDLFKFKGIKISFLAIKEIVEFAKKYIHDRVLPDSALMILHEAQTKLKSEIIDSKTIKEVTSRRVNIPLEEVGTAKKQVLLNLEERIHKRLVDQEQAVKAVADTLRRAAVSMRELSRPIGSFLFVGPTGVGKTELAKTLAQVYFGSGSDQNRVADFGSLAHEDVVDAGARGPASSVSQVRPRSLSLAAVDALDPSSLSPLAEDNFFRFDMSEYQTEESFNRLIGTESNPGELTEAIKNKPYALILLDEFEKANLGILNLFLQVFEDGRLTDGSGKTIDFTNTIIIATSNAGSLLIAEELEKGTAVEKIQEEVKHELLKIFKPELVNRFDEIVIFKSLSPDDLQKIVSLKLKTLQDNLKDQGYLVEFEREVTVELAKRGYDKVFGARPLRRLIQDTLEARLSRMILEGKIKKGEKFIISSDLLH